MSLEQRDAKTNNPRHRKRRRIRMSRHCAIDRAARTVAAVVIAFGLSTLALAASEDVANSSTITVFADRYIVRGRAFDDLDVLEKHITAGNPHVVNVLVCGARATRALKAVIHRFRHLPVQIRVPDLDEPECLSTVALAMPVRDRVGERPFSIDDEAVDRYWRELMP
jgi:hypothetical protein